MKWTQPRKEWEGGGGSGWAKKAAQFLAWEDYLSFCRVEREAEAEDDP